ncbi:TetR/AcrR family transcriptional regulator [Pseudoroseicyclus sp. CXY001]|uniref:TetR/AcrR family transcriptional regulator n=1 Tax=Pseudoroseicyclus sp. CXY001 TaxID=3242492 RepID=UPI003571210F
MEAIQRCALSLARDRGIAQVTTEEVATAAGISPRTFFNYFPFKEAAFVPPQVELPEEARIRFCKGKGRVAEDLLTLLYSVASAMPQDRDMLSGLRDLAEGNPRLMALHFDFLRSVEAQLTELFRQRGGNVGGERAPLMAALTTAAVRSAYESWMDVGGTSPFTLIGANIVELAPIYDGAAQDVRAAAE